MIYFANNSSARTKVGHDRIEQQEFSLIKFVNVAATDYTKLYQNMNIMLDVNKATSVVTGIRMNRGTGFGLEVPCVYKFYGEECSIKKLRSTINTDPKSSSSKKRKM